MDELLLKNYELLSHIKNEYDKLVEENESLKLQLNQNINTITNNNIQPINIKPNNIKPLNTRQEEFKISGELIKKYPKLVDYKIQSKNRLYVLKNKKQLILDIITDEGDKFLYNTYCKLLKTRHDNDRKKNVDKCEARLFSGGYNIENITQCDKNKVVDCYCVKHSNGLLYGNVTIKNTDGWLGHSQPHSKGFIKKMDEYFIKDLNKGCYARVIIKGNGGYFNFKRCNCPKVNENYCNNHLINLKDGDVRYVGSKYFPFHYQQYSNIKVSHGEKGWTKKMEELFPKIYFTGDNILDLNKYDIYGNDIYS